jgi:hypothetical protein
LRRAPNPDVTSSAKKFVMTLHPKLAFEYGPSSFSSGKKSPFRSCQDPLIRAVPRRAVVVERNLFWSVACQVNRRLALWSYCSSTPGLDSSGSKT